MIKKWICTFFLLTASLTASTLTLKDKLATAEPGSYIVIEQNKNYTLLHVYSRSEHGIVLEEVTIPAARYKRSPAPWRTWFESGAPGHTSWMMSQINVSTGEFEETFSFTHNGWINLADCDPFLTTLLNLQFQEVPEAKRRRVGLPPGYNKRDTRPYWAPRLVVDGQRINHVPFGAYAARWPCDGSELSRKVVEIYLPYQVNDPNLPDYPTYFPYWIEVDGKLGSAKVRIIDSGTNARSPKPPLPLRPPELIGDGKIKDGGLALKLKAPGYNGEFIVVAEEAGALFGKTFPLPCEVSQCDNCTTLFVSNEELIKHICAGEIYRFLISPTADPSVCVQTRAPLEFGHL